VERNARHAWSNNQRALAPQPGCQEEGTRTLQGYRSLRSLAPGYSPCTAPRCLDTPFFSS